MITGQLTDMQKALRLQRLLFSVTLPFIGVIGSWERQYKEDTDTPLTC